VAVGVSRFLLLLGGFACASVAQEPVKPPPQEFESQLHELREAEGALLASLASYHEAASRILTALVTFSRHTPPALALSSPHPEDRVRQALVLRSFMPFLKQVQAKILQQQKTLQEAQQLVLQAEELLKKPSVSLSQKHEQMRDLLKTSSTLPDSVQKALEQKVVSLADQVRSMDALIKELEGEMKPVPKSSSDVDASAFCWPAEGKKDFSFGKKNPQTQEYGKGMLIYTAPKASVVAPASGSVVFSGLFRSYGKIIIIEHAKNLHSLVAGLETLKVSTGKRVARGELLGLMGKRASPCLTFEVRKEGKPINPRELFQGSGQ
jgi:septal ring factor EnvC (AmiA/AmiB activator)